MALTSELYEAVVRIVDDRIREIKVTREMYDKLAEAVHGLAQAQKVTELRVAELTEAQKATELRMGELAQAQRRTEEAITSLSSTVGRLTDTIGHDLESIARVSAPDWLGLHMSVKVPSLERRVFKIDGEEVEVNLYGEGVRHGVPVLIAGEAKSTVHGRDVAAFSTVVDRLEKHLHRKVIKILFAYWIHPSAESEARRLGVHIIAPPSRYPRRKPSRKRGAARSLLETSSEVTR